MTSWPVSVYLSGAALAVGWEVLPSHLDSCCFMLLLPLLELAFGQLFFNDILACVCVLVWGCSCCLIGSNEDKKDMRQQESRCDSEGFNQTAREAPGSCLIENIRITSRLCLCHAPLVFVNAGLRPTLFNQMLASVCVPVWSFSFCLIENALITSGLLLSPTSLVFVRAGLRPALFLITCLPVSVYLSRASLLVRLRILSPHLHSCCLMLLLSLLELAFGQLSF